MIVFDMAITQARCIIATQVRFCGQRRQVSPHSPVHEMGQTGLCGQEDVIKSTQIITQSHLIPEAYV